MIETQIRELTLPKSRYVVEVTPQLMLYRCVVELRPSNGQIGNYGWRPTHPNWEGFRDAVLQSGLRAAWSTPILSHDGKVLGTFCKVGDFGFPRP